MIEKRHGAVRSDPMLLVCCGYDNFTRLASKRIGRDLCDDHAPGFREQIRRPPHTTEGTTYVRV